MKHRRNLHAVKKGRVGLSLAILTAMAAMGLNGCTWDSTYYDEFVDKGGALNPCPPKIFVDDSNKGMNCLVTFIDIETLEKRYFDADGNLVGSASENCKKDPGNKYYSLSKFGYNESNKDGFKNIYKSNLMAVAYADEDACVNDCEKLSKSESDKILCKYECFKNSFEYNLCPSDYSSCQFGVVDSNNVVSVEEFNKNSNSFYCKVEYPVCEIGQHYDSSQSKCVDDDIDNCGAVGYNCPEKVAHWVNGMCKEGVCTLDITNGCESGYRVINNMCASDCTNKQYYDSTVSNCVTSDKNNCGSKGYMCNTLAGWLDGDCAENKCIASSCQTGYHLVDGKCEANTQSCCGYTNGTNCRVCSSTEMCNGDVCSSACTSPLIQCGSGSNAYCANLSTDMENCNGCGKKCETSKVSGSSNVSCVDSTCIATACGAGYHLYNNTCEEDKKENCGAHGNNCSTMVTGWADGTCSNGACAATRCQTGYHLVNGKCEANTQSCCGYTTGTTCRVCSSTEMCNGNTCSSACTSPLIQCGSGSNAYCANTSTDMGNCNGCGKKCETSKVPGSSKVSCVDSTCIATACGKGYHLYNNTCEEDKKENCGAHGNNCSTIITGWADGSCSNGACVATSCQIGYHLVDGKCVANTQSCCGYTTGTTCRVCSSTEMCDGNTCSSACTNPLIQCGSNGNTYCANLSTDMGNCSGCGNKCETSKVPGSSKVSCVDRTCIATACGAGNHLYNNACEEDKKENCGAHGNNCSTMVTGWADGTCSNGACVATSCQTGYHLVGGKCEANTQSCCGYTTGTTCRVCSSTEMCNGNTCSSACSSPLTQCGSNGNTYCANFSTDMENCNGCGKKCETSKVPGSSKVSCVDRTCIATACGTGNHLYNNTCEEDKKENCGAHGNDCSTMVTGWADGTCSNGACVATSCQTGYHLVGGKCEANTQSCCGYTTGTTCRSCKTGEYCSGNECKSAGCPEGTHNCGGGCLPEATLAALHMNINCACTNGYDDVDQNKANGCEACSNNFHMNGSVCEADTPTACGAAMLNCESLPNVKTVSCNNGACVVNTCTTDFHVNGNNTECVEDTPTACGSGARNCTLIPGAINVNCSAGNCVVDECDLGYYLENNECKANSKAHCGNDSCGSNKWCCWGTPTDSSKEDNGTGRCRNSDHSSEDGVTCTNR